MTETRGIITIVLDYAVPDAGIAFDKILFQFTFEPLIEAPHEVQARVAQGLRNYADEMDALRLLGPKQ